MKKIASLLTLALLGAVLSVSCSKMPDTASSQPATEQATLTVSLSGIDADIATRASSTAENSGDKTASSTQIFIFDSSGNMLRKLNAAGSVTLSKGMVYTVSAVINGPDVTGSLSTIENSVADLASNPFVMYGKTTADLSSAASASATVAVSSLASRVRLTTVTNGLPGAFGTLTLKRVYLCNVVAQNKLDGTSVTAWYNQYGRKALATRITANSLTGAVDSSTPAAASTFKSYDDQAVANAASYTANAFFYCFPNALKTEFSSSVAASTEWSPQSTWITVCGSVGGTIYYWTTSIGAKLASGLARNYSYDVALTINNLGTADPGTPVTPGSASISVSVTPWQAGSEISETI